MLELVAKNCRLEMNDVTHFRYLISSCDSVNFQGAASQGDSAGKAN